MKAKGLGSAGAVGVIILLVIVGFFGYTFYREHEAMNNLESDVTGAGVPTPSLDSVDIPIEMEFHNMSNYDSPPFSVNYDIYIGDENVGEGSIPTTTVSAGETETVTQTITVDYTDVGSGLVEILQTGEYKVTIEGEVKSKLVFGLIPISQTFENSYSF